MASGRVSKVKGKVLDIPTVPTIGTATAGAESASVAFTAATKGGPTFTYTVVSNPDSITGTGTSSPVTVSGLTAGTSYTFTVKGTNPTGSSEYTAASNSVTPTLSTSYESIATVSVGSGGSSYVEFTSISSSYKHLQIRGIGQTNRATYPIEEFRMQFNSDTGSNYAYHQLDGDGGSAYAQAQSSKAYIQMDQLGTTTGGTFGAFVIDILDYASTSKYKTTRALAGEMTNSSYGGYYGIIGFNSGLWQSTSAITSIKIYPAFSSTLSQYTHCALYGIRG
jgi:hypothetical protein